MTYYYLLTFFLLLHLGVDSKDLSEKANEIHRKCITIDTHCDTPMKMINASFDLSVKHRPPSSRVDFPRMVEGGLDAIFFGVFTGQKPRTEENYKEAYQKANQMIDSIYASLKKHHTLAELAVNADDASRIEPTGKRAIYIGLENGFPLAKDITRVKEFYERGVRYITLCHVRNNDICDSSTDKTEENNGLSSFGQEVVKEMNRLGMLIDVSHLSNKSVYDILQSSQAPVFASHSGVHAICHSKRNIDDELIKAIARKGGVIQVCLFDGYVKDRDTTSVRYKEESKLMKEYWAKEKTMTQAERDELEKRWDAFDIKYASYLASVKDMVDHIDHIKKLVGVDYIGIGSDFDGGAGLSDCADVSQFPNITKELLKRGYTEEEIRKIWGGNFFRVFKQVEEVAKSYKK